MRLLMLLALIAGAGFCAATSADWTGLGADPTDWSDAGNWSVAPPPDAGDVATFDSVAANISVGLPSSVASVVVNGVAVRFSGGGELTVTGTIDVQGTGSVFGVGEAITAADPRFRINVNGTLQTTTGGSVEFGHGDWRFAGSGATLQESTTVLPTAADSAPTIWLTGASAFNLTINGVGGANFWADRILPDTSVTQDGLMLLAGNLVFEGTASWSVNPAGNTDAIEAARVTTLLNGEGNFTDNTPNIPADEALDEVINIVIANGNVALPDLLLPEQTGFTANGPGVDDDESEAVLLIIRHAQDNSTGMVTLEDVTVEADTASAILGTDDRNKNLFAVGTNAVATTAINGTITLNAAASGDDVDSGPALLIGPDPTRAFADPPVVTLAGLSLMDAAGTALGGFALVEAMIEVTGTAVVGASATLFFEADVVMGNAAAINANAGGMLSIKNSAFNTANATDTYAITSTPTSVVVIQSSDFSAMASDRVTLGLGGSPIIVNQSTFSNYTSAGLNVAAGSQLAIFNENEFSNGVSGGAHVTLNGLSTDGAGFENFFDVSVAPLASGAGTGMFVAGTADGGGGEIMTFANTTDEFGLAPTNLTAAAAQTDSGTNVAFLADINALRVTEPVNQRSSIRPNTTSNQTVLLFDVEAISTGGTDTVVDDITINFEALEGTLTLGVIQGVTLYLDTNGDETYDTGEELAAGTLDQPLSTISTILFDLQALGASQTVTANSTPVRWGVAITFSQEGMSGYLRTRVDFGDITVTPGHAILGLPLEHDVRLTTIKRNEKTKEESGCTVGQNRSTLFSVLALCLILGVSGVARRRSLAH